MVRRLVAAVGAGAAVVALAGCGTDSGASTPTTVTETVTVQATAGRLLDAAPAPVGHEAMLQYDKDGIYPVAGDTIDRTYSRIPAGWYVISTNPDAGDRGSWARCRTLACSPNDTIASGTLDGGTAFSAVKIEKTDAAFKMTGLLVAPGVSPIG
ncbi:hypothetical protein [Prescottella agglutinans]|uniref:Uncharacterized protein n=1 Tax=Prescottella agglutinans TaxID=1644129 RepID=A0ABT6MFL2_9NOCA|nr:hypothetical protein [Prescottella agglutinans]MDH6283113.1 hypothetical protein [Prescottella agglutinans]